MIPEVALGPVMFDLAIYREKSRSCEEEKGGNV